MKFTLKHLLLSICATFLASGCASQPEMETVNHVDLERFMGRWYVIANIPTFVEKGAHNAVESYELNTDGTIATTFTYRADGFDGKEKSYHPKGFVKDTKSNAVWGMRFIWPFKADYRIVYLDADYTKTIIGRNKRDYLWIMARDPQMPAEDYEELVQLAVTLGYDPSKIEAVPQRW